VLREATALALEQDEDHEEGRLRRELAERERARALRAADAERRATAAASELAEKAAWLDDRVVLELWVLLGDLLAQPGQVDRLRVDGAEPLYISKAKLRATRAGLRPFGDVSAYLDHLGLHFRWHGGEVGSTTAPGSSTGGRNSGCCTSRCPANEEGIGLSARRCEAANAEKQLRRCQGRTSSIRSPRARPTGGVAWADPRRPRPARLSPRTHFVTGSPTWLDDGCPPWPAANSNIKEHHEHDQLAATAAGAADIASTWQTPTSTSTELPDLGQDPRRGRRPP